MIIAVDGPTASGKGTISRRLAADFALPLLDTGALYRAVGLAVLDAGEDPGNGDAAIRAARALDTARIDETRIRASEVGAAASIVAANPGVRAALFDAQRAFAARPGGAILDGRDIGTVICPDADVKIYITASLPARAERRWKELQARGESVTLDDVAAMIQERDARDASRAAAPAAMAADAVLLDTTYLSIDEAASAARALVEAARTRPRA
ncbi:MAG: (d)CMP kinase [Alphaproteobacteria bacterium]|nr:(d)CMP kinase [Alphaproteobacteria bacterium]